MVIWKCSGIVYILLLILQVLKVESSLSVLVVRFSV